MSAMWNSGRLRIRSTTRVPDSTPRSARAVANRVARSAYSAQVSTRYPSPSFQRSATASAGRGRWPRNLSGTVSAGHALSELGVRDRHRGQANGNGHRSDRGSYPQEPVEKCRRRVENLVRMVDTDHSSSRGVRWGAARAGFSTPTLLGTHRVADRAARPSTRGACAPMEDGWPRERPHVSSTRSTALLCAAVLVLVSLATAAAADDPETPHPDPDAYRALAISLTRNTARVAPMAAQIDQIDARIGEHRAARPRQRSNSSPQLAWRSNACGRSCVVAPRSSTRMRRHRR